VRKGGRKGGRGGSRDREGKEWREEEIGKRERLLPYFYPPS